MCAKNLDHLYTGIKVFDGQNVISNESGNFDDPQEFDDPQVFDDPKGTSIVSVDFFWKSEKAKEGKPLSESISIRETTKILDLRKKHCDRKVKVAIQKRDCSEQWTGIWRIWQHKKNPPIC